ncbi:MULTISPECIES: histone-like nucleoid-structuring protein Lsr2 [unclassified Streptomyces]|uniref:Lsr2 family DNA-binding protein n=1 Tax=unclassified Streptomyces TaxID=2593676 RepID=UPI002E1219AF|nr:MULTISPECIES: histone-like nucleoid-structuring protein Lsr2 [unclassified Streptomyces]WSR21544.1 Lsr2 family protein [Streptomyces sp. NBC_01205]
MTDINLLVQLCPPPSGPIPAIDWDTVEATLGMRLPQDYKQLAATYGPGAFYDYLHLYHPAGVTEYVDITGPMPARIRSHLQRDYDQGTHPVPYDPQHLFAIGGTDNGEYLFWITDPQDAPDTWRIAVNEARGPRWFTFDGSLTEFLTRVLSGQTSVPQFPDDLLEGHTAFVPSVPTGYQPMPPTAARPPVDLDTIRKWARANGYQVPFRGRIPADIREAWERANPS